MSRDGADASEKTPLRALAHSAKRIRRDSLTGVLADLGISDRNGRRPEGLPRRACLYFEHVCIGAKNSHSHRSAGIAILNRGNVTTVTVKRYAREPLGTPTFHDEQ